MFTLIFAVFGFASLGAVWPNASEAFVAMNIIFKILDTKIDIDARDKKGLKPLFFKGKI